jgi:hypothetical protein
LFVNISKLPGVCRLAGITRELGDRGFACRQTKNFLPRAGQDLHWGRPSLPFSWNCGVRPRRNEVAARLLLVPRLRKSGAIPLLLYAFIGVVTDKLAYYLYQKSATLLIVINIVIV